MIKKRGWLLLLVLLSIGYVSAWKITLNDPTGRDTYTTGNVVFSYSTSGADYPAGGTNCTLWGDFNGTWRPNQTDYGVPVSATSTNFSIAYSSMTEWGHKWNINCTDYLGGSETNWSASNATFIVDYLSYGHHLNITILEKVNHLALFDNNILEAENESYYNVTGTVNISNQGDETLSDIYVCLTVTNRLKSNLTNISGRGGSQVRGSYHDWVEYGAVTAARTTIMDLDNDGKNDDVHLNSTHLFFNLSRAGWVNVSFNRNIASASGTPVTFAINESQIRKGDVIYGFFTLKGTTNLDNTILAANTFKIIENDEIWLHVPELRRHNFTVFSYWLKNSTWVTPPLNIMTDYTHAVSPKVLADSNISVTSIVKNEAQIHRDITNVQIVEKGQNITWNGTDFRFVFYNTSVTGDYNGSVTVNHNQSWTWVPNAGTGIIGWNQSYNISWTIHAPASVPTSGTYNVSIAYLRYRIGHALSNMTVKYVNSTAEIHMNLQKRIVRTLPGLEHNVTWRVIPTITTPKNMTFDLISNTLWVTFDLDPNNLTTFTTTTAPATTFNMTNSWTGTAWNFNYTDGSNDTYPPPVVWMNPVFRMRNEGVQIMNYSVTWNNSHRYVKAIYIVNGYWLEVYKNISNRGNDSYFIRIEVKNIGNGYTPQNQLVTVYDFVPHEFTAWSFSPDANADQAVGNATETYYGTAYKWDIPFSWTGGNASLAPNDHAVGGPDEWNATYVVNGTGDYRVTELYIVGLDPRWVDGAGASPLVAVENVIKTLKVNTENIYLAVVLILVVLNVTNLVITSRINKKL